MPTIDVDFSSVVKIPEVPKEMLSIREEGGKTVAKVNFSSLSILQECWRKSKYYFHDGLRSNTESEATLFGTAIHAALETYYSAPKEERTLPRNYKEDLMLLATSDALTGDALVYRAGWAFKEKAAPLASLPDDDARSLVNGLWILGYYFQKYIDDPYQTAYDAEGKPMVERSFTIPIYEDDKLKIEGFGKIDVILFNPMINQYLVCDHKTTTQIGNSFFKRVAPNFQYSFYILGAREAFGLDVDTFLVNGIQVKPKPKTSRGSPPDFPRQITRRGAEDFEELKKSLTYYVKEYIRHSQEGIWPMSTPNACTMYSGCQYHDICATPSTIRQNIINGNYSKRG